MKSKRLAGRGLYFISRRPETFTMVTAKTAAWAAGEWNLLDAVVHRRDAAPYWISEQTGEFADQPYRLVVHRSNTLDRRRARALERRSTFVLITTSRPSNCQHAIRSSNTRAKCMSGGTSTSSKMRSSWMPLCQKS